MLNLHLFLYKWCLNHWILFPCKIPFPWHSVMWIIWPISPIKSSESSITHRWPRNCPYIIPIKSFRTNNLTISQSEWICTLLLKIISWRQSSRNILIIIIDQPFLHILYIIYHIIIFSKISCPRFCINCIRIYKNIIKILQF